MHRRTVAASVLSALLLWGASPAVGAGWLAWVALVPTATIALGGRGTRAGALAIPLTYAIYLELLLVPSLPFGLAEGQWGDPTVPVLIGGSPVIPVALVAVPLFGAALYLLRFGQPWGWDLFPAPLRPAIAIAVPAVAWTALDFLRTNLDPGGLWGPLFLSQVGAPSAGIAALGGPWLLTLLIVAVNYSLALALVRRRPLPAVVAVTAAAASFAAGAWSAGSGGDRSIAVAAIQPGYDTAESDRPQLRYWRPGTWRLAALDLIRDLGELTREASSAGAQVVVWPEASAFTDFTAPGEPRRALGRLAAQADTAIVAPYFLPRSSGGAATIIAPGGLIARPQPKQRPMWFLGEERASGSGGLPAAAGPIRIGTLLGVDLQDPSLAAGLADRGAEVIAASTHDWAELAPHQGALARLSAIASGAPVVRSDWRYGSAVYDRNGDSVDSTGHSRRRAFVTGKVSPASPTPYARIGDLVAWGAVAATLLGALSASAAALRRRRAIRVAGPAFDGPGPRRESPPRRPSPGPPHADAARSPPRS